MPSTGAAGETDDDRAHRRHLRRGIPQPLHRVPDHRPRPHLARACRGLGHRQRGQHHPVRLRGRRRPLRRRLRDPRRPPRRDRAAARAEVLEGPRREAGPRRAGAHQPERPDLPHGPLLQHARHRGVLPYRAQGRLLRQRQAEAHRALRARDVVGADSGRGVRARPQARLRGRADGRQPLVLRRQRGLRARCRDEGRRGDRARARRGDVLSPAASPAPAPSPEATTTSRSRAPTRSSAPCCRTTRKWSAACPRAWHR